MSEVAAVRVMQSLRYDTQWYAVFDKAYTDFSIS